MTARTIDDVLRDLDAVLEETVARGDRNGMFAALYRKVTARVKRGIEAGEFDDGERMERLDVRFADRYLAAYRGRRVSPPPSESWAVAFAYAERDEPMVLQHLLGGMNAHINVDLGVAAAETVGDGDLEPLHADFERINDVLEELTDDVVATLTRVWPLLSVVSELPGELEDELVGFSMRRARDGAWRFARRLAPMDAAARRAEIARVESRVADVGRMVFDPPRPAPAILAALRSGERGSVADVCRWLLDRPAPEQRAGRRTPNRRWTDELLDRFRAQGDPGADAIALSLLANGDIDDVRALLRSLTTSDRLPATLTPRARALIEREAVPSWADPERLELACEVFERYAIPILQSLLYRSLPELYALGDGAEVLHRSQQIEVLPHRRIRETLTFVIEVMSPDALEPDGLGVHHAQRVRLLHAAVRTHLLARGWDPRRPPINQEELAATLVTFSGIVVDSMERFGIELSAAERGAWMHRWNVVGALMGIDDELLFADVEDSLAMFAEVRRRHHRRSEAGVAVMKGTMDFADALLAGEALDGAGPMLVRHLCGDALADLLDVPPADWTSRFVDRYVKLWDGIDRRQDRSVLVRKLAAATGRRFLDKLADRVDNSTWERVSRRFEREHPEARG